MREAKLIVNDVLGLSHCIFNKRQIRVNNGTGEKVFFIIAVAKWKTLYIAFCFYLTDVEL